MFINTLNKNGSEIFRVDEKSLLESVIVHIDTETWLS